MRRGVRRGCTTLLRTSPFDRLLYSGTRRRRAATLAQPQRNVGRITNPSYKPNMDGRALFGVARELAAGPSEAHWRSSVWRAHYGLLHEVLEMLRRWSFALPPRDKAHTFARTKLIYPLLPRPTATDHSSGTHPGGVSCAAGRPYLARLAPAVLSNPAWPGYDALVENLSISFVGARSVSEIIFIVEESPEGGYTARALGPSIFTEADDWGQLRANVRDAVSCHFEEGQAPKLIRLHFVREEVLTS